VVNLTVAGLSYFLLKCQAWKVISDWCCYF